MENTSGFTTVTPLVLQRTCFTSEQDRLNEFAKALRVPVQTGQIIKGDKGDKGERGEPGPRGAKGDKGADGEAPTKTTIEHDIANGVDSHTITGVDIRTSIINLRYDDDAADPGTAIGILCIRFTSTGDSVIYFTAATPDDKYKLVVTSF